MTVDGGELRVMPGTLARTYERLGGRVVLMGKPAPVIYASAVASLGLPPARLLAVGDSLEHDIKGCAAGSLSCCCEKKSGHRRGVLAC